MIELKDVTKEYSKGISALNGINLKIEQGEFVFIVGDSGSGKSTLIKLIMKELEPTSGTIIVNGHNLGRMRHRKVPMYRRNIGVVFQDFRLLKDRNIYEKYCFCTESYRDLCKSDQEKSTGSIVTGGTCTEVQSISKGVIRWRAAKSSDCKSNRE